MEGTAMDLVTRCVFRFLPIVILFLTGFFIADSSAAPGDILLSFPAPGSGPRDLAWDGTHLWILDDQEQRAYEVDPTTGDLLRTVTLPAAEPVGLAWWEGQAWVSDAAGLQLKRMNAGLEEVSQVLPAPGVSDSPATAFRPGALTADGKTLWSGAIAGWSSRVSQVDAFTGKIIRFVFTKGFPEGVATDGDVLWTVTSNGGHRLGIVYAYDYESGLYLSHFDTPGDEPAGLAFDGEALWCADRKTMTIHRLALQ